jgi:hypothetical protein
MAAHDTILAAQVRDEHKRPALDAMEAAQRVLLDTVREHKRIGKMLQYAKAKTARLQQEEGFLAKLQEAHNLAYLAACKVWQDS